ncbi:hypothetical protein M514_12660 [Trichuris suis]|uniref:Serum response factor homolog n=1 Tax=Trichuris suis TaxID=68888 RepID=A0A085MTR6_9BILA|nr:hypothetical protein M513_12660 [Trichuris suis]KFD60612.1 hypothetical protein M514_12660 [Trichuris suis]
MSTTTADHFAEMVPGESFFSLTFPSQEDGAAQPPCESQQTSCMDSDDTATNKEDDEEDESTEMGASLSPSSVHIVNPESPDDDAYAGQQCIESSAPMDHQGAPAALSGIGDDGSPSKGRPLLPNGKKTKGRVKIKMEFIDNKLRRYTTFSKRKTGIMKKAYELSTLTGTQVMLLVASETGHVYTFATKKLQPMITSEAGKALIQTCLNSTDGTTPSRAPELGMTESSLSGAEAALFTSSPASSKCNGRGGNGSGSTTHPRRTKLGGLSRTPGKVNYHRNLPQGGFKNNSKSFSLVSSFANDLPTMVTPVPLFTTTSSLSELAAAFQSSDEGEPEVDESRECSPSVSSQSIRNGLSPASGLMTSGRMQQSAGSAQGWNLGTPPQATNSQLPQRSSTATAASSTKTPVFSFTGMLPNGSLTTSGQQQPFGFIPAGIAPNGAFMYQMPSGLVYAAPTAAALPMTTDMSGQPQFMFAGFPTTASAAAGVQDSSCGGASSLTTSNTQQQYITIPVPIPITPQSLLHPGLMQTFQTGSPVKEEQEEQQQQQQEQKGKE